MKRIRRRATSGRKTRDSLIRPWSRRICLSLSPVIAGRPGSDGPASAIPLARSLAGIGNGQNCAPLDPAQCPAGDRPYCL